MKDLNAERRLKMNEALITDADKAELVAAVEAMMKKPMMMSIRKTMWRVFVKSLGVSVFGFASVRKKTVSNQLFFISSHQT
jgi:hypothetical protein